MTYQCLCHIYELEEQALPTHKGKEQHKGTNTRREGQGAILTSSQQRSKRGKCIPYRILHRNRTNAMEKRWEGGREREIQIYYKDVAHVTLEDEKSQDLQVAS